MLPYCDRGYKNLVAELIPNVQVVADRFHVMKGNVRNEYNYLPWNS
ncbi:transposase [aff. Roholtiella sp. LEGE 12411]|nr:transposase [aff. Roholtiella sp. LEGE 12411]